MAHEHHAGDHAGDPTVPHVVAAIVAGVVAIGALGFGLGQRTARAERPQVASPAPRAASVTSELEASSPAPLSEARRREALGHHMEAEYYRGSGQYARLVEAADRALAVDPGLFCARRDKVEALVAIGDDRAAIEESGRALALRPETVELLLWRAGCRIRAGDLRGVEDCDRALTVEPDSVEARYLRAVAHHRQRRYGEAQADLSAALERDPRHLDARWLRSQVRGLLNDVRGAVEDLQRFLELAPRGDGRLVEAQGTLGQLKDQLVEKPPRQPDAPW